jgi:hypothetical protein
LANVATSSRSVGCCAAGSLAVQHCQLVTHDGNLNVFVVSCGTQSDQSQDHVSGGVRGHWCVANHTALQWPRITPRRLALGHPLNSKRSKHVTG